jgi:hypothetical protein
VALGVSGEVHWAVATGRPCRRHSVSDQSPSLPSQRSMSHQLPHRRPCLCHCSHPAQHRHRSRGVPCPTLSIVFCTRTGRTDGKASPGSSDSTCIGLFELRRPWCALSLASGNHLQHAGRRGASAIIPASKRGQACSHVRVVQCPPRFRTVHGTKVLIFRLALAWRRRGR